MNIANKAKTALLTLAVLFTTTAMAGTQETAGANKATTEQSFSAENNGPKPKYKNTNKRGIFSNTRKVTCHAGWSTKANKNLTGNKRVKSVNFPGT